MGAQDEAPGQSRRVLREFSLAGLRDQDRARQKQSAGDRDLNFLLDTNVVSEWVKPQPEPNVLRWFAEAEEDSVWLSVITFAEIRFGVERMAPGRRRAA